MRALPENMARILRWDGKQIKSWRVLDQHGRNVEIRQCMHQMKITEDYILLSDSSFKTTPSILVNNPFPTNWLIDRFLREVLASPMLPYLQLWIVKKDDLDVSSDTVQAVKMPQPIPLEAIHYSVNYSNPKDRLTLYLNHNVGACAAEWLRPYDQLILPTICPRFAACLAIMPSAGWT